VRKELGIAAFARATKVKAAKVAKPKRPYVRRGRPAKQSVREKVKILTSAPNGHDASMVAIRVGVDLELEEARRLLSKLTPDQTSRALSAVFAELIQGL
jgi:hypothetical protein